jgi:diguanylate cyclase (GGDEF)-like protein
MGRMSRLTFALHPMALKTLAAELGGFLKRARTRAASLFPLGITARLTFSFLAVAALAATANLLAQQSVSVILWNTLDSPTLPTFQPNSTDPRLISAALLIDKKSEAAAMESAIDRLERAAESRSQLNSPANDSEFGAAIEALRRSTQEFLAGFLANPIQKRSDEYVQAARELVLISDQRRLERADYSKFSKATDDRVQNSLDGAWKIFGRIIARQSLISLRADLDAVRLHSDAVVAGDGVSAKDLEALTASESAFSAALAHNKSKLIRSEGADWVARMESEAGALTKLRRELISANKRYNAAVWGFSQAHQLLFATINEATLAPQPMSKPATSPTQRALAAAAAAPAATLTMPEAPPATSTIKNPDHHARDLMAEVTAIVLLLVVLISITTVRSVVAPVKRILQGSRELARGNTLVRVVRGGVRELDTLAGAFNDMAARLAAAHETARYQHETLEEKVRERTHQLQTLAQQDPLTSLPNRRHLSVLLNDAMERATRDEKYVGVFFLDIDNFKNFNDSLGHVFGDRVLMSVANRLEEITEGLGLVARLGGDEFTVVYEGADSEQSIRSLGSRLVQAFGQLLRVDDRELSVSVSVGASIFPDHAQSAEGLLRAADSALFRAKELGRSRAVVFTQDMVESAAARFSIEQGLRRALERGEFELHYQPEIDLATMEVGLVEALLRWRMPDGRLARPGEFLAIADQSGLINEINKWVMQSAVEAVSRWHHGGWLGARVAINVSPRQLLDVRFAESMLALLREFRVPPQAIELELTETVLQTGSTTIAALRALQSYGFGIALDDFGTGYSSLTSLEQLPLSRIKLDRSLIASIDSSSRSAAITRAIIDLCSGLDLQVTAEGVERPAQLAWLSAVRSIWLQGYLLSDAVPFEEVLACRAALVPRTHNLLLSLPDTMKRGSARNPQTKGAVVG